MTQPNASEITLLRSREQRTQLYLSIYQPKVVFAARINDVNIGVGQTVITFDTVSSGAYTGFLAGMTLYVGSTPGDDNYGRIRVRSATATTITVAANSDINWKDNLYLTVKDFHEVWPIRQTVQTVGNTPATDQVLVFKDSDIAYVDQNDHPGSLIWMGSHQAKWLESGLAQIYWSATGTVNTEGAGVTYAWNFEGGTPSTSALETPGLVTYNTAGHYVTQLNVTSANGIVDTSYRYVSIYDNAHQPIVDWGMDDLKGTRKDGAYTTSFWVRQPVSSIVEGALVVIFSKSYYGTISYSFVNNIEFVGYILNDSITYDYANSKVEFDVGSVTEVMKSCDIQGLSLSSVQTATNWSEMGNLTVLKTIWWFLKWHTTILSLVDIRYIGANLFLYAFEPDPSSIYDALAGFMETRLLGTLAANRRGQIICEVNPETIHQSTIVTSLGMSIDHRDWMASIDVKEATRPEVSYLEMGGYVYNQGTSGTNTPYLACAPGITPSYFGKIEEKDEVILSSGQAYLNTLVGDVFAYENARYPETTISFAGNYGNIEFIPSERYLLTVEAKDSQGRVEFIDLPVHPIELTWKYVPEKTFFSPEVIFHEVVDGYSGTYLDIPQSPIDNIPPVPPYDLPPFIPGSGIPWGPPIIPPVLPGNADCFLYTAPPTGPYMTYPDVISMDSLHPVSNIYFPCKTRHAACQNPPYITIAYSAQDDAADHINSVDILNNQLGIVPGGHMVPGVGTSINRQSVQVVHNLPYLNIYTDGLAISGFRINYNNGSVSPGLQYLTCIDNPGGISVTEGTTALLGPVGGVANGSYEIWQTPGMCPALTEIYINMGDQWKHFYYNPNGVWTFLGSGQGSGTGLPYIAIGSFDKVKIIPEGGLDTNFWDNYKTLQVNVLSGIATTPIQLKQVMIGNVCPL